MSQGGSKMTQFALLVLMVSQGVAGEVKPSSLHEAEDGVSQAYSKYFDAVRKSKNLNPAEQRKLFEQIVQPAESSLGQFLHDQQMQGLNQNFKIIRDPSKVPKDTGPKEIEIPKEIEGRLNEILKSSADGDSPQYKKKKVQVVKEVNGKKKVEEREELVPADQPDYGPAIDGSGVPKEIEFRGKSKKVLKDEEPSPSLTGLPSSGDNVDVIEFKPAKKK